MAQALVLFLVLGCVYQAHPSFVQDVEKDLVNLLISDVVSDFQSEMVYAPVKDATEKDKCKSGFQTGIGTTASGKWGELKKVNIGTKSTNSDCWKACIAKRKDDSTINGVSYDKSPKRCWCVSGMKKIGAGAWAWQSCFLDKVVDISEYKCALQTGIGIDKHGSWKNLKKELISTGGTDKACWEACAKKGGDINGVSYDKPPKKCWCVSGMKRIGTGATAWKACFLQKVGGDNDKCKSGFQTGIGTTASGKWNELKKVKVGTVANNAACWKACIAKQKGDNTINGVSYDKGPRRCWCVSGMKKIGAGAWAWQSCFLDKVVAAPKPVDGSWSTWSMFSVCYASCGPGKKTRSRTCTKPSPANGGAACKGESQNSESCQIKACPVDGSWSSWSSFSVCSASCGPGKKTRSRTCTKPSPAHGGANCKGESQNSESCQIKACPEIAKCKSGFQTGIGTTENGKWSGLKKQYIGTKINNLACWKGCVEKQKGNNAINGVSYDKGPRKCWCVFGMKKIGAGATAWQSCFLEEVGAPKPAPKSAFTQVPGSKGCWTKCGGKGGKCNICGTKGYCCRKGNGDCPEEMRAVALDGQHSCVAPAPSSNTFYWATASSCDLTADIIKDASTCKVIGESGHFGKGSFQNIGEALTYPLGCSYNGKKWTFNNQRNKVVCSATNRCVCFRK